MDSMQPPAIAAVATTRRVAPGKAPPLALVGMGQAVRNGLESLRRRLAPPSVAMMELSRGFVVPRAIYAAASLGIADHLADGPRSVAELAAATGADARSLYRLLRALASVGVFRERRDGQFALTLLAATLRRAAPGSIRDFVLFHGSTELQWLPWGELPHSVRTGRSAFERVHSRPLFEHLAQHPDEARVFAAAMAWLTGQFAAALLAAYDFAPLPRVVDVGGGNGRLLTAILQAHPTLRGTLFDRPSVVDRAHALLKARGVAERCAVVGGDFFAAVPEGGDAYLLKNVVHDWDDERALVILTNCRRALGEGGRLLLMESVIPPGNGPSLGKLLDLDMLVTTSGGRERTAAEFRLLLAAAGFRLTRIIATAAPLSVIEAVPDSGLAERAQHAPFAALDGHRYARLTTHRKSGEPVSTTIWFALDGGRVYVRTAAGLGKLKRIRNDPRVLLAPTGWAPSRRDGKALGPAIAGRARILPSGEAAPAARALYRKYGWQPRLFDLYFTLRRKPVTYIEIVPA